MTIYRTQLAAKFALESLSPDQQQTNEVTTIKGVTSASGFDPLGKSIFVVLGRTYGGVPFSTPSGEGKHEG